MLARIAGMFTLLVAVQALFAGSASATTWTWDGSNGTSWGEPLNWDLASVPTSGAPGGTHIVFNSFGGATSTMDILGGLTVDSITFTGSGKTINGDGSNALGLKSGTSFVMAPGVTNIVLGSTLPVVVAGSAVVNFSVPSGLLTINSAITGTADMNLFPGAASTIEVGSTGRLATSGIVSVASGLLRLNNNGTDQAVTSSQLVVGVGLSAATLALSQGFEIGDSTDVFVNADGLFNMNGFADDVGDLTVRESGKVTVGGLAPGLDVKGTLAMSGGTIDGASGMRLADGSVAATSNAAVSARIDTPIRFGPDGAYFVVSNGPQEEDLIIEQPIAGGGPNAYLDKGGPGRLALKQPSGNTYDGGLSILTGQVRLAGTAGAAISAGERVFVGNAVGTIGDAGLEIAQANALPSATVVDVLVDGVLTLSANQSVASLGVAGGRVTGAGSIHVPQVTGSGGGVIEADLVAAQATTLSAGQGGFTVTDIGPAGAFTGGFAKIGAGTLTQAGTNTLFGTTDVQAGTLVANGTQTAPVQVAPGATLQGTGTVGATTVAGTLAPGSPALTTGDLAFAPTGALAIAGPASAGLPRVNATGNVSIDPAAQLNVGLAADPIAAAGTQLPLLVNDGGDPVNGRFGNVGEGAAVTGASGQRFTAGYGGGDGNDLALTASVFPPPVAPVAPVAPAPGPGPRPARDTTKPKLTFTAASRQKLSRKNTFAVKLKCDEACTVKLATSVKPAGKKSKTGKATKTIKLKAGRSTTVNLAVPKTSLSAVKKAVRARKSVSLSLSATAADAAGNKSATVKRKVALKRS